MQTSYEFGFPRAINGMLADSRSNTCVSKQMVVATGFGLGVFKQYASDQQARLPVENQCVITDSAGTFTAGSIVTTVNGTAITTNFGTDKDTTMTAHAAAIAAGVANVSSCAYSAGSHTITIQTRNTALVVTVSVAGVTGTMTISSVTNTSLDAATNFLGVTVFDTAREQAYLTGVTQLAATECGSIITNGAIYVQCEETVTSDDAVYVRTMADGAKLAGMFGKTSVSGKTVALTNCRFAEGGGTTQQAKLVINNP
jgi:hypothetical protein